MKTNSGSIRLTQDNAEVSDIILTMMGPIAQRSEPPAHNRSVPGSNPGGPTTPTEGDGARRDPRTQRLSTLRRTGTRRAQGSARNGESAMTTMCPARQRGFFLPIPQHLYQLETMMLPDLERLIRLQQLDNAATAAQRTVDAIPLSLIHI